MFAISLFKSYPGKTKIATASILLALGLWIMCCCLALSDAAAANKTTQERPVAVLLFHGITTDAQDLLSGNENLMPLTVLEETFQALKGGGFQPISLETFHAFIDEGAEVPERAVLLTFDDGYKDIYTNVLPLTKRYSYPAVSFAISKWFDRYPRMESSREHLSVAEAEELLKSGLWDIGGHSYDGHRMVKGAHYTEGAFLATRSILNRDFRLETISDYRARVWQDIIMNTHALQLIGVSEPKDFAFPYGAYNQDMIKLLSEAGYRYLYTLEPGLNEPGQDPFKIRRITASDSAEETIKVLEQEFAKYEK